MAATSEGSGDPDGVAEGLAAGTVVAEGLDAGVVVAVACVTDAGGAGGEALDSSPDPQAVTESSTTMLMSGTSVLRRIRNNGHLDEEIQASMWAFPTQEEPSITLKTPSRAEKFPSGYAQIVEQEMPIWVTLA